MTLDLPPIILKGKHLKKYQHIKYKYPVSGSFLRRNYEKIKRFLIYALVPHFVLRRYAWRKRNNRIVIVQRVRHFLFDPRLKRMIKKRKRNVKQWTKQMVRYRKNMGHIEEYEETELYDVVTTPARQLCADDLSKQMKEQLELLKSGKRGISLITDSNKNMQLRELLAENESNTIDQAMDTDVEMQSREDCARQQSLEPEAAAPMDISIDTSVSEVSQQSEELTSKKPNFLDILMSKVSVKSFAKECNFSNRLAAVDQTDKTNSSASSTDEDFLGFDEANHVRGMLPTPLVPSNYKTQEGNSAFVSESLDEYMRKNNINPKPQIPTRAGNENEKFQEHKVLDGLVTAVSSPPHMEMPAVPETLQKMRTVAERRQYLQRFSKNHKMSIINNEANIYRELNRKHRNLKVKSGSMQMLQALNTQMPFTREGWQAASYVATDHNKYYYQVINVDGKEIKLPGTQGNNAEREKPAYSSKLSDDETAMLDCNAQCVDAAIQRELKIVKTKEHKVKLNRFPLPSVFRPCPLSQKPFQKPLDDDTAALLLAGGSMAVVSMPTVELEVDPQIGRPLDEIAKRYLQYILPHHDITREWAEFCVSTLQQPATMRAAEAEAAKTPAGRRKSFTFVIPYLNDRNHILVRRVVDRSEQLDASFAKSQVELQQLDFRKELPAVPDEVQLTCADMISDMINTVAISCSENSFISEDPDGLSSSPSSVIDSSPKSDAKAKAKCSKMDRQLINKQNRLRMELRRLNATIIDAAAKSEKDNEPCSVDFCQLGCVCDSLATERPMREHCGKESCQLECKCKGKEKARVMRVETDGRGISNEDAFNLRRKATARLAKMEKEFTSTLVLTENETLLINESQSDKKRRCTKAPKRYEDFADTEEELHARVSPPKPRETKTGAVKRSVVNIESTSASNSGSQITSYSRIFALSEPCMVKDTDAAQLMHCYVPLRRLADLGNVATFCMTHHLYKCFCGGESLDGKPVIIEKELPNSTTSHYSPEIHTRAHYSFERASEEPQPKLQKPRKDTTPNKQPTVVPAVSPVKGTSAQVQEAPPPKPNLNNQKMLPPTRALDKDIIGAYTRSKPYTCRRGVSIPVKSYLRQNRRRALLMRQQIASQQTPAKLKLLGDRMFGAIRFYREELERERIETEKLPPQSAAVIEVRDDDSDENAKQPEVLGKPRNSNAARDAARKRKREERNNQAKRIKVHNDKATENKLQTLSLPIEQLEKNSNASAPQPTSASPVSAATESSETLVPRITGCYSLNAASIGSANTAADVLDSNIVAEMSSAGNSSSSVTNLAQDVNFRSFYNEVVKNMNALVSKKMQDIDLALQRESKIIPAPNEEILCIIKWTNFLAAFESDLVYIWDVKMKNYNFLAATTTNMMPSVFGALGVVNINALEENKLPAMALMLMDRKRNENTGRLAVVMQGRQSYWLVRGFLRHMLGNACTKPTPQTHPVLTKKINVLCSLLVKQRIREHQRKAQLSVNSTPTATPSATPPPIMAKSASTSASSTPPATIQLSKVSNTAVRSNISVQPQVVKTTDTVAVEPTPTSDTAKNAACNIRTNIEFRKVNKTDVNELQIPEQQGKDHRWVVLDLYDDFSHIFVPAFKDMISLDRIHNVMRVSSEKQKVVKLQFFKDAPYDAYVTPSSLRKIYFGPLRLDVAPPVLVLLQSVDGKMMLREVYQQEHSISVQRDRRTMAFWVLIINSVLHFELDNDAVGDPKVGQLTTAAASMALQPLQAVELKSQLASRTSKIADAIDMSSDNDDDCVIVIEDDEEEEETPAVNADPLPVANAKPLPVANAKPLPVANTDTSRVNFTIQQNAMHGGIQILPMASAELSNAKPLNATLLSQNKPAKPAPATVLAPGAFVPLISKVPIKLPVSTVANTVSSPSAAPQFLTPHVQVTQTNEPATIDNSVAQPKPPKISRISVSTNNKLNDSLQELLTSNTCPQPVKLKVGTTGITITKYPAAGSSESQAKPKTNVVIGAGVKRNANGVAIEAPTPTRTTVPNIVQTVKPAVGQQSPTSVASSPKVVQKSSTTISIQNLRHILPRPPKTSLKDVQAARHSLPTKLSEAAKQTTSPKEPAARRSGPGKLVLPTLDTAKKTIKPDAAKAAPTQGQFSSNYGFIVARGEPRLPRFRAKRTDGNFLVKVPDQGVMNFNNPAMAAKYLNRQLARELDYQSLLPAEWIFMPSENPNATAAGNNNNNNKNNKNNNNVAASKINEDEEPAAILIED